MTTPRCPLVGLLLAVSFLLIEVRAMAAERPKPPPAKKGASTQRDASDRELPRIVAHRGASHAAPENTLPAFRLAFEEGADFIEGDFWLTRDEQIVCLHDEETSRVAPASPAQRVRDSSLAELRKLDVGAWKHAKYASTRIPTLEEVLAIVPSGKGILIEIKDDRPAIAKHLKRVLEKRPLTDRQIVVIAFDPAMIQAVKAELPKLKAYWLYWWYWNSKSRQLSNTADEILQVARSIKADGLDINKCQWTTVGFARQVRAAGLQFHVYTVNEPVDAVRYTTLGVDSITTDRPAGLRQELEKYFSPLVSSSDQDETLLVRPDGTWTFSLPPPKEKLPGN